MASSARRERFLDASWQRVESFDEEGPSQPRRPSLDAQGDALMTQDGSEGPVLGEDEPMHSEGDWQYEDEEELITLDLGPESKRLVQMSQEYSIAGLDSSHPYLQLGNLMFKGTWDQLIGTEIILQDRRDAARPQELQHTLWPLPPTESDRRHQRPPSTTRRRIVLRQAANMAAKEAGLVRTDEVHPPLLHVHAPVLKENKTGLVTYKGWVWVRGRGWMRKEDAAMLQRGQDGVTAAASNIKLSPSMAEQTLMDVEAEVDEPLAEQADDDDAENDDNEHEGPGGTEEAEEAIEQAQIEKLSDEPQKSKGGRKKLSHEESIRYKLWRAMCKVEQMRQGEDLDSEEDE